MEQKGALFHPHLVGCACCLRAAAERRPARRAATRPSTCLGTRGGDDSTRDAHRNWLNFVRVPTEERIAIELNYSGRDRESGPPGSGRVQEEATTGGGGTYIVCVLGLLLSESRNAQHLGSLQE